MGILEYLGQFFAELWPPWRVVPVTHTAVRQRAIPLPAPFRRWADGRRVLGFLIIPPKGVIIRDCGCGFVFRIPWIDELDEVPVELVSEDLENIEVETASGRTYDISPVLRWKTRNPIRFVTEIHDAEASMKNEVRSTILKWANQQDDRIDVRRLETECTELVREFGAEWGCFLQGVSVNSCAPPWDYHEVTHRLDDDLLDLLFASEEQE